MSKLIKYILFAIMLPVIICLIPLLFIAIMVLRGLGQAFKFYK